MFATYHNLGFIHIYSHASIVHIILPLIKPFNKISAITSSQPSHQHTTTPMVRQLWIL